MGRRIRDKKVFVRVIWWDATDEAGSWLSEEDAIEFGQTELEVISFGYLVNKTKNYITLAADWIEELETYGRVTKIPSKMVVDLKTLRKM